MTKRKLFCEISPLTYQISKHKCCIIRRIKNLFSFQHYAKQKVDYMLPILIYQYNALMRRKLGNVELQLQENKVQNLKLSTHKVSGVLIKPGEVFSFWKLIGACTKRKGYHEGLTITGGNATSGVGGGMCQFTNLIHWLVLHTPLEILEHHHHDGMDLFPDYGRQIPFGTGTSIFYNYLDYQVQNNTTQTYQLIVYTTDIYLCGEIRATEPLPYKYHIKTENERFVQECDEVFRTGMVYRDCIDKKTGNLLKRELIKQNHAKVLYDTKELEVLMCNPL